MNKILSLTRRCVEDYEMIQPGDRIAVGVSGGKDSLILLVALAKLREFYPAPFTVEALTLDNDIIIHAAKKMEIRCNEENFAAELDGDAVTTAPLLIEMESEPIKFLA